MGNENQVMKIEKASQDMLWAILNTMDYTTFHKGEVHLIKPGEVADGPFYHSPIILVGAGSQGNKEGRSFTPPRDIKNVSAPYLDVSWDLQQPHLSGESIGGVIENMSKGITVIDNNMLVRFLAHGKDESKVTPLNIYDPLRARGYQITDFHFLSNEFFPTRLSYLKHVEQGMVKLNNTIDGADLATNHRSWLENIAYRGRG